MKIVYYTFLATLFITFSCNAEEPELPFEEPKKEQTIRELVTEVFPEGNVFIGAACHHSSS